MLASASSSTGLGSVLGAGIGNLGQKPYRQTLGLDLTLSQGRRLGSMTEPERYSLPDCKDCGERAAAEGCRNRCKECYEALKPFLDAIKDGIPLHNLDALGS